MGNVRQADVAELLPAAAEETESAKRPGEVAETEPALKKAKVRLTPNQEPPRLVNPEFPRTPQELK
eukprot:1240042-Amphidinium_carterae.1